MPLTTKPAAALAAAAFLALMGGNARAAEGMTPAVETLASAYTELADRLAAEAEEASREAAHAAMPRSRIWPGPSRPDAVFDPWTAAMIRHDAAERAARAAGVAKGIGAIARALSQAAEDCRGEAGCGRETDARDPVAAVPLPAASQARCEAERADLGEALAAFEPAVMALEEATSACAAIACPVADCTSRATLIEAAAFTERVLAALDPGSAAPQTQAAGPAAPDADRLAAGTVAALAGLGEGFGPAGVDGAHLAEAAQRVAKEEAALSALAAETAPRGSSWRAAAVRLSLAGVRDALGRLQLAAAKDAIQESLWDLTARRMAAAALALTRLAPPTDFTPPAPPRCLSSDPEPARAMLRRLRTALDGAAVCNLRAGCETAEAVARGTGRADLLIHDPVLESDLELLRILTEEAGWPEELVKRAAAAEDTAPSIGIGRELYRQGEAVKVRLRTGGNRCMADGGFVAIVPSGDARRPNLSSIEVMRDVVDRVRLAPGDQAPALFAAPPAGTYALAVFGGLEHGGRELSRSSLVVAEGPPETCKGWTGTWRTEFGRMVTVERDGQVSGTYRRTPGVRTGFVMGEAKGDVFEGIWISEIGSGGTRLHLRGDGVFRGAWGTVPKEMDNGGLWSGICIAPGNQAPPSP